MINRKMRQKDKGTRIKDYKRKRLDRIDKKVQNKRKMQDVMKGKG